MTARAALAELVAAFEDDSVVRIDRALESAHAILATPEPSPPREPTDDDLVRLVYKHFAGADAYGLLLRTVWKDSIDVEEPSFALRKFVKAIIAAPAAVAPEAPLTWRNPAPDASVAVGMSPSRTLTIGAAPAEAPQAEPTREHDNGSARGSPVATTGAAAAPTAGDEALPEAADDDPPLGLVATLYNTATNFSEDKPALADLLSEAAARIESLTRDNSRLAERGQHYRDEWERVSQALAASREREQALRKALREAKYELGDWDDGGDHHTHWCPQCDGSVDRNRRVRSMIDALLASPDSAPQQEPQK